MVNKRTDKNDKFQKGFDRKEPEKQMPVKTAPVQIQREKQNIGRSKFEVAKVRRNVGPALAGVVHTAETPLSTRRVARPIAQPEEKLKQPVAKQRPAQRQAVSSGTINIQDERRKCKRRPTTRRKGSGAGRSFVPWCG